MDLFSNIPSWISAVPAAFSAFFAGISWYQSNGSKKAKAKAEERAQQAEELLEQMQQLVAEQQSQSQSQAEIAANLYRPILELTHTYDSSVRNRGKHNPYYRRGLDFAYRLRNVTKNSIEILELVNSNNFYEYDLEEIVRVLGSGESVDVYLRHRSTVTNLELRIRGHDDIVYVPIPR